MKCRTGIATIGCSAVIPGPRGIVLETWCLSGTSYLNALLPVLQQPVGIGWTRRHDSLPALCPVSMLQGAQQDADCAADVVLLRPGRGCGGPEGLHCWRHRHGAALQVHILPRHDRPAVAHCEFVQGTVRPSRQHEYALQVPHRLSDHRVEAGAVAGFAASPQLPAAARGALPRLDHMLPRLSSEALIRTDQHTVTLRNSEERLKFAHLQNI